MQRLRRIAKSGFRAGSSFPAFELLTENSSRARSGLRRHRKAAGAFHKSLRDDPGKPDCAPAATAVVLLDGIWLCDSQASGCASGLQLRGPARSARSAADFGGRMNCCPGTRKPPELPRSTTDRRDPLNVAGVSATDPSSAPAFPAPVQGANLAISVSASPDAVGAPPRLSARVASATIRRAQSGA